MTDEDWERLLTLPLAEQVDMVMAWLNTGDLDINSPVLAAWVSCNNDFIRAYLSEELLE